MTTAEARVVGRLFEAAHAYCRGDISVLDLEQAVVFGLREAREHLTQMDLNWPPDTLSELTGA